MSTDSSSSITLSIYLFGWLEKLATILFISFNLNLPFRVVTLLIYMSEIPLLDQFSYLLLTEQFTGIIPVGHQTFVSALKIPAMKISKNLFIPFSICPANREFHILSTIWKFIGQSSLHWLQSVFFFFLFLFFEGKVMGLYNTLFTFHYPIFQKVRFIWPMSKNKALHIKNKAAGSSSYESYY